MATCLQSVSRPKRTLLDALTQAAERLETLAHPHRPRMVQILLQGRCTVGELAEACEISSHMLARTPWNQVKEAASPSRGKKEVRS